MAGNSLAATNTIENHNGCITLKYSGRSDYPA
jgi:hypothetical protein